MFVHEIWEFLEKGVPGLGFRVLRDMREYVGGSLKRFPKEPFWETTRCLPHSQIRVPSVYNQGRQRCKKFPASWAIAPGPSMQGHLASCQNEHPVLGP